MSASTALYGVSIHEAIKSGDIEVMKNIQQQAEAYLKDHGDVGAALEILKVELAKQDDSSGPIPLYGVIIHEAIASGDVVRMKKVLRDAEAQLAKDGDVRSALTALRAELGK